MFKQFIRNVSGADVFLVTGFLFFLALFAGVCLYVLTAKSKDFSARSNIPFSLFIISTVFFIIK